MIGKELPRALGVNRSGYELLSRAAFSPDQYRGFGGRHVSDELEHFLDLRALPDNCLRRAQAVDTLTQFDVLSRKMSGFQRPRDQMGKARPDRSAS